MIRRKGIVPGAVRYGKWSNGLTMQAGPITKAGSHPGRTLRTITIRIEIGMATNTGAERDSV
jgi:hypothetical protein